MKRKKMLILSAILIGVISAFSMSKVQATEITSAFSGETITRNNLKAVAASETAVPRTLGITKTRASGNWYGFNVKTDDDIIRIWKIANFDNSGNLSNYNNLYYCLNAGKGFVPSANDAAEGAYKLYDTELDMTNVNDKANIVNYAGGYLGDNYNQVLWILDHSYVPTGKDNYEENDSYKNLMKNAGITIDTKESYDLPNPVRTDFNLTEEDIEVVQQMAIWYYTNSNETDKYHLTSRNLQSLYFNGAQLSSLYYGTDEYGEQISGLRQEKASKLFTYYITEADKVADSYNREEPQLTLKDNGTTVKIEETENGDAYILGPYHIDGENISYIDKLYISEAKLLNNYDAGTGNFNGETSLSNTDYEILDSKKNIMSIDITNIDKDKFIDNDFYIKVSKSKVQNNNSVVLELCVSFDYAGKTLRFMTNGNEAENTQPVVMVTEADLGDDIYIDTVIPIKQIKVTKDWDDDNNQDGKRPESVTVQLCYIGTDGKPVAMTGDIYKVQLNVDNNWQYTWDVLAQANYTVRELDPAGNMIEKNGKYNDDYNKVIYTVPDGASDTTEITNIRAVDINGTKTWDDNNNQDGKRPTSITVNLLANGTKIKTQTVTSPWTYSFTGLSRYDENGEKITYTIDEESVEGYTKTIDGYNITNTHIPEKVNQVVTKVWDDGDNQDGTRTDSVTVTLYKTTKNAEGEDIKEKIEDCVLNADNEWTKTWENLDKYSNGEEIVYTIEETVPNNYTADYNVSENKENNTKTTTITNKYTPGTVNISVIKEWVDEDNVEGLRPDNVTVVLYADGKQHGDEIILNKENGWTYTWSSLPEKKDGVAIKYEVKEEMVGDQKVTLMDPTGECTGDCSYYVTYKAKDGEPNTTIITNTHAVKRISIVVEKRWDDEGNENLRPNSIKMQLYADGEKYREPVVLSSGEDGKWDTSELTYTWADLLENKNGKKITYTVQELDPDGNPIPNEEDARYNKYYKTTYASEDGDTEYQTKFVVTNKYDFQKEFDLSLRKFITKVNNIEYSREPVVDASKIGTTDANGKVITTATYKHTKQPIAVQKGDVVTYTIRVYNEGELDGYVNEITDYLPDNLIPIIDGVDGIDKEKYKEEIEFNSKYSWTFEGKGEIIKTTITSKDKSDIYGEITGHENVEDTKLNAHVVGEASLDYIDVQVKCLVTDNAVKGDYLTNIAEITDAEDITGNKGDGTDSKPKNADTSNLTDYKNDEALKSTTDSYVPGQEDDDDFEKLVIKEFDLALKKFIKSAPIASETEDTTKKAIAAQEQEEIEVAILSIKKSNTEINKESIEDTLKDVEWISDKEPYSFKIKDGVGVIYTVTKDGKVTANTDEVKVQNTSREPVVDASKLGTKDENGNVITNAEYKMDKTPVKVQKGDVITYVIRVYNEGSLDGYANEITDDIPEGLEFLPDNSVNVSYKWKMLDKDGKETTDVANAVMITTDYLSDKDNKNIIPAVSENDGVKTLSYKDVEVQFKVVATPQKLQDNIIKNVAQISADSDNDIDSTPSRNEKYDYTTGKNEDDIDYAPIKVQYFDLALRKFITKVNTTDYNNRYPEIVYNVDGSITYKQTKDPVLVATGDTVTYTIRIYNEGEIAGAATEIIDNLPEGLEFIKDDETNKKYGWKLLDYTGNETDDLTKAVKVKTEITKDDIIDAFVESEGQKLLSFKDVQIVFKVTQTSVEDKILVNTAEISNDSGDDVDSIPGNNDEKEDDLDKEYVKVEYFDLSLKKWVTETQITYDGKTTIEKTNFTEDTDEIAKVDIATKKLNKTTLKFKYSIKVTNEGELPGYATEIKDYIPNGLRFVAEDNPDWKEAKSGEVVTDKLKDTLLNPGESATVEIVLTWKNSSSNMGVKTNYAEISQDSGDDIDSTPDNFNKKEDDIDDAQVIISIKTAGVRTYIGLILLSVTILAGGAFLIKKYVITK